MRASEWIQIAFSVMLALAAWSTLALPHPLPARRRWTITWLAMIPIVAIAAVRSTAAILPAFYVEVLRDWLTAALLLAPYWQTGQFFLGPKEKIQARLMEYDAKLLPKVAKATGTARTPIGMSLEAAYLFCYPLVPAALLALYAGGRREHVAGFWLVVLLSTYFCYAVTPFFPAYPPRSLVAAPAAPEEVGKTRSVNRWVLKHGSIHAISFPSAHIASALAVALALLRYFPWAGVVFLAVAVWIGIGAVVGRYHYAVDVILGAVVALAVFFSSYRWA